MAYKQKCLNTNNIPVISRKKRSRDYDQEAIPNRVFSSPAAPEGRPLKRASSQNSLTSTSTKSRYRSRNSRRNIFRMLFPSICSPKRLHEQTTNELPITPSKLSHSNFATPETDSPETPKNEDYFAFERLQGASRNLTHQLKSVNDQDEQVSNQFSRLCLSCNPSIFEVPEIVSLILKSLDEMCSTIPFEHPPMRRAPLSYQHAYLIHGDHNTAKKVWRESNTACGEQQKVPAGLYSCMLVNRMWYRIALERLESKVYFAEESKLMQFSSRPLAKNTKSKTELFILHKLTHAKQVHVDAAAQQISGNLKWLEFYICPKVLPPVALFTGEKLRKLVLPGNTLVSDEFLARVSLLTPNLEILDVRACELVSDYGIYSIAQNCPLLSHLNVGRHSKGHLITDSSIAEIGRKTQLRTLGVAGCHITDRSIWEICLTSGSRIERLSLNNCFLLTNNSLPKVLSMNFLPLLSVLEIRRCLEITDLRPFVEFKRRQQSRGLSVLIEGCEQIEAQMRETELVVDMEISQRVMNDIQEYLDQEDED